MKRAERKREKREGALFRRTRDIKKWRELAKSDSKYKIKVQRAEFDVANLKRKLKLAPGLRSNERIK